LRKKRSRYTERTTTNISTKSEQENVTEGENGKQRGTAFSRRQKGNKGEGESEAQLLELGVN